jgi:alpha-galactosidase
VKGQIEFYKEHRELLQRGRFLRLKSPYDGDGSLCAWACVSEDARRAVVGVYRLLNGPNPQAVRIALRGLDPSRAYHVSMWPRSEAERDCVRTDNEGERGGDELMAVGLSLADDPFSSAGRGDFWSTLFVLESD